MSSKKNSEKLLDKQIEKAQKEYSKLMVSLKQVEFKIRGLCDKRYKKPTREYDSA